MLNRLYRRAGELLAGLSFGLGRTERIALFLLLLATFGIYQPGLYGDFVFDDMSNITYNKKLIIESAGWQPWYEASMSSFSGIFKRPISMLSFAVNASTTGMNAPLYFKLTNLLIHLGNGLLVFWLARLTLRRLMMLRDGTVDAGVLAWGSLLATALWLLHPLNLTSVLYIVQRMTSLSALFTFLALALYLVGRNRLLAGDGRGWRWIFGGLFGAGLLAVLSKENGILIPLMMLAVEVTLYRFSAGSATDGRDVRRLRIFFVVTVLLPAIVFLLATLVQYPKFYAGYELRDFTMGERLMTQARVIWLYLQLALMPKLTVLALYHDDLVISRSLFDPWTTLPAIIGVLALLATGFATIKKSPPLSFAILWYFAGHALESTTLPLELIHEHRNYLPLFGPFVALAYAASHPFRSPDTLRVRRGALACLCVLAAAVTYLRAESWGNFIVFSVTEAQNHPLSERANQQLGRTYTLLYDQDEEESLGKRAEEAYRKAIAAEPVGVVPLVSLLQLQMRMHHTAEPAVLDELAHRLATKRQSPAMINGMRTLIDCQMFAYCKFADTDIYRVFAAADTNPLLTPANKGLLKLFLAQYEVDKRADLEAGIKLIQQGLAYNPDAPDLQLNMARLYRVARAFDLAEQHLAIARRLNTFDYLTTEITEETAKLERDRKAVVQAPPTETRPPSSGVRPSSPGVRPPAAVAGKLK